VALAQLPQSKVEMARLKGVTRGAVSLASRPGHALYPAVLAGGRIDRGHPAARKWLGEPHLEDGMTADELAKATGLPADEVRRAFSAELAGAVLPCGWVGLETFSMMAGERVSLLLTHASTALRPALTPSRYIDVAHPAALAYLAARPFPRDRDGDPIVPREFPALGAVGDDGIDIDNPFVRAFMARCLGRVPTDADFGIAAAVAT
jgi:hypothetical protein